MVAQLFNGFLNVGSLSLASMCSMGIFYLSNCNHEVILTFNGGM